MGGMKRMGAIGIEEEEKMKKKKSGERKKLERGREKKSVRRS